MFTAIEIAPSIKLEYNQNENSTFTLDSPSKELIFLKIDLS
jgi:hypothetical protein